MAGGVIEAGATVRIVGDLSRFTGGVGDGATVEESLAPWRGLEFLVTHDPHDDGRSVRLWGSDPRGMVRLVIWFVADLELVSAVPNLRDRAELEKWLDV